MTAKQPEMEIGPYRADDVRPGERYELVNGHRVYCAPAGGAHSKPNLFGGAVVAFDPKVQDAGVDTGFELKPELVRAPDVAVGNIPDSSGWVKGRPELAIEYADVGQDEGKLQEKIRQLLTAGTRLVWVVRLTGPRRVEVYERGKATRSVGPGVELTAPGILKNAVPVEALYEPSAAKRAALTNLLQGEGYENLAAVLAKGEEKGEAKGRVEGLRGTVRSLCRVLAIDLTPARAATLDGMNAAELDALRERLERDRRWD